MKLANMSSWPGITVYAYKKGQMTMPTVTSVYGSDSKTYLIPKKPNTSYSYQYRITQDDMIELDQPSQRCHDDSRNLPSVSQCIAEYFEATYNCSLYMLDSLGQREDCTEDYASYEKKNAELLKQWAMKTEVEIYQTTGCMPSCKGKQIRLETVQETTSDSTDPIMHLNFQYRDGKYNLNEEYLVYDYYNFIADIGGYLGLLLGHSILSVYSMSSDWITKPIRTIGNCLAPGSKKTNSKALAAEI